MYFKTMMYYIIVSSTDGKIILYGCIYAYLFIGSVYFLCKNCDDLLCSVRGNLSQVSLCVHDNKVLFSVLLTSCMVMWKMLSHFWWNYARFLC